MILTFFLSLYWRRFKETYLASTFGPHGPFSRTEDDYYWLSKLNKQLSLSWHNCVWDNFKTYQLFSAVFDFRSEQWHEHHGPWGQRMERWLFTSFDHCRKLITNLDLTFDSWYWSMLLLAALHWCCSWDFIINVSFAKGTWLLRTAARGDGSQVSRKLLKDTLDVNVNHVWNELGFSFF